MVDVSSQGTRLDAQRVEGGAAEVAPGALLGLGDQLWRHLGIAEPTQEETPEPQAPGWLGDETVLLRELGRGASGVVYEAHHPTHGRCAAKWLRQELLENSEVVERFHREVALQEQLAGYPGVVTVAQKGSDRARGHLFMLMELVEGESLHDRLRAEPPLGLLEGVRVLGRVARAVEHAHGLGIVHRDLKPQNVLLTRDGQVRLTDFGLAKALEADEGALTQAGVFMGTPGYMAPEQIDDARGAERPADVYGWGAMLYHLLAGRPPIQGKTLVEALRNVSAGRVPPLPPGDPELVQLCRSCLARHPSARPTIGACAEAIEAFRRRTDPGKPVSLRAPRSETP
ncbi:MAG: serine/threonine-protein kinase [Planctomycetota bacterium]